MPPAPLGTLFPGLHSLGPPAPSGLLHGGHREGRETLAVLVGAGAALLPLLGFVARVAPPSVPCLATGLVPSPWRTRQARWFSAARGGTLALPAGASDPSSAHVAPARAPVGACRASVAGASVGRGKPCHGHPV